MIDFYRDEDFSRTVFYVEDGEIVQTSLLEVCLDWADMSNTPDGTATTIHVRDNELWTWRPNGTAALVQSFVSKDQAAHAKRLCHLFELEKNDDAPAVYNSREDALDELAQLRDQ